MTARPDAPLPDDERPDAAPRDDERPVAAPPADEPVRWHGAEGDPLVVLAHDWNGRLPWTDAFAARLAAEGFRVAVPDFHGGRATTDASESRRLLRERTDDMAGAHRIVREAIGEARATGSEHVGLVGFSMGAMIALEYAAQGSVDAVVAYYGAAREGRGGGRVPVLFQLAERDTYTGKESPAAMRRRLASEGFDGIELRRYAGAKHGFQNAQVAEKFDADASEAAWASTLAFLREHLGT